MLKYTDDYITVKGVKIHYYRTGGKKPPFILLHGASDDGLCWTPIAAWLARKYDVIMMDAQGHGLSARLGKSFSVNDHVANTIGLINQLGLKKPLIMGHSMGAGTTVSIAVGYPALPKAIILEDPAWMAPDALQGSRAEMNKQREAYMKSLAEFGKRPLKEIIAEGRKLNPTWSEEELKPWAEAKRRFDPNLFKTQILDLRTYEELVPQMKCPTLLIVAESGIVAKSTAEKAAKLWKSRKPFKWVYVKGAGHNIRREQTAAFKKAVRDFLKGIGAW